ncbi:MAG: hypothetical protein ACLSHC_01645 [Bilophila wadsworthia]
MVRNCPVRMFPPMNGATCTSMNSRGIPTSSASSCSKRCSSLNSA